jgi:DNA-binding LacI/PurR family transcriptional regulator
MATIKDVAVQAGVSIATVSRVLNHTGTYTKETEKKVLRAVENLGYRINLTARSLKTGHTGTIGIAVTQSCLMETPAIIHSALRVLQQQGFSVEIILDAPLEACVSLLKEGRQDGLLLIDMRRDEASLRRLMHTEYSFVFLGGETDREDVNLVEIDIFGGGYTATKHLIAAGHRDILFIEDNTELPYTQEIKRGYLFALDENGISYKEELLIPSSGSNTEKERSGYDAVRTGRKDGRYSAVLTTSDHIAFGVLSAARDSGIAVPEQLSVTGFGNLPQSAYCNPGLTSVKVPYAQQGELGAEILVNNIRRRDSIVKRVRLQTQLIERRTVARKLRGTEKKGRKG